MASIVSTSRRALFGASLLLAPGLARAAPAPRDPQVRSPDGRNVVTVRVGDELSWSVSRDGRVVLEPSALGLAEPRQNEPGPWRLASQARRRIAKAWRPTYGIASVEQDHGEELILRLRRGRDRLDLIVRAYDAGVAVRYRNGGTARTILGEATAFRFPTGAVLTSSRDEGGYATAPVGALNPAPHPDLTESSDKGALADLPALARLADGRLALIAEADRLDYPRAMLTPGGVGAAVTHLMRYPGRATGPSGPGDTPPEDAVVLAQRQATPWRVLILADQAKDLIAAGGLITTLATPSRVAELGWIKPGRAYRIRKYTTAGGLEGVAFAVRRKLDFIEYDWRWYGDGTDDSDATVPIPGLDIRAVIDAARAKGIGMILYVDRAPAMKQLQDIVRTYQAWGVAGVKFGFVWEGRQTDNIFIQDLIKACADHQLLVSLHDNLRPAGLERTYPNYVSLEGVRGNEQFPTAHHNLTLPFIRGVVGPTDYTICYDHPRNQTTNAHQLALAVLLYNPLTFLYWYDEPAKYDAGYPELAWFDACPTVWDETVALGGEVGAFAVVARRSGARWFLGAATNQEARRLSIDLGFLESGTWRARIFADGMAAIPARGTPVVINDRRLAAGERLELDLAASGGQAIILEPV